MRYKYVTYIKLNVKLNFLGMELRKFGKLQKAKFQNTKI